MQRKQKNMENLIGEKIKSRRNELGLSQREVSRRADCTYQTVLNAEKGKKITMATLFSICSVLGLEVELN